MKADTQLQTDVLAELENSPGINANHICVDVKDGVLSLTGEIDSLAEKLAVERVAQSVSGVLAFSSDICVMQPSLSHRSDVEIALAAENVLRWMSFAPTNPIGVQVESGLITLTGELELEYQRRAAVAAVRQLVGVTGVSDHIEVHVQPTVKTSSIALSLALLLSSAVMPSVLVPSAAMPA